MANTMLNEAYQAGSVGGVDEYCLSHRAVNVSRSKIGAVLLKDSKKPVTLYQQQKTSLES